VVLGLLLLGPDHPWLAELVRSQGTPPSLPPAPNHRHEYTPHTHFTAQVSLFAAPSAALAAALAATPALLPLLGSEPAFVAALAAASGGGGGLAGLLADSPPLAALLARDAK
jgi:hypothetical protein